MWWSDRRGALAVLAGGAAALGGCGFTPTAAPGRPGGALDGAVTVAPPDDRDSFDFVSRLENRLGRPDAPRFRLSYSLETSQRALGITPEQAVTRFSIVGRARYRLTEIASGREIDAGEVGSFTSYSGASSTLSTATARADARERLMVILADRIVTRLQGQLAAGAVG